jgi:chlorophyll(ide) b reductase
MMKSKTIVITGSTRGFGRELAEEFLIRGNRVVICSKNKENVHHTEVELKKIYDKNVHVLVADVSNYDDCVQMTDSTIKEYGGIDILINNAGTNAYKRQKFLEFQHDEIESIVNTNLLGTLNCCHAIMPYMLENDNGVIINVEGAGSENNETEGYAAYGATKSGITQFTTTLRKEYENTNVHVCLLSPGMMFTNLLVNETTSDMQFIFDTFGEDPSYVSKILVPKILQINSDRTIRHLTWCKIMKKIGNATIRYISKIMKK